MRNTLSSIALTSLVLLGLGHSALWAGPIYTYDPSLGTLPEAQGFTRFDNLGTEPAPTVGGGLLHQFSSGAGPTGGAQYWYQDGTALNFTTMSYALEADLHVLSSNYIPNIGTGQRSGYYLQVTDSSGVSVAVGIAGNGITINTDSGFAAGNGVPFTPFDSTDGFHTYRLLIDGGIASLFIDGNLFASTPLGGSVRPDIANHVLFGDLSGQGASETDLRFFQFGTRDAAVPEPASLLVWGTCAIGLAAFRRRKIGAH